MTQDYVETDYYAETDWRTLATLRIDDLSLAEIGSIIDSLSGDLRDSKFDEIDGWFSTVDIARVGVDAMIAVARTSYSARSHLKEYDSFVKQCIIALAQRGEEGLLKGLPE